MPASPCSVSRTAHTEPLASIHFSSARMPHKVIHDRHQRLRLSTRPIDTLLAMAYYPTSPVGEPPHPTPHSSFHFPSQVYFLLTRLVQPRAGSTRVYGSSYDM